tara:strand:- start:1514 stop:1984 length:471 start_codon:yes stop_codon:yes gene_type:complete
MVYRFFASFIIFLFIILLLSSCGGEELLEETVDGLLITGTVIDATDTPDPFVPLTIYVANFVTSPNTLVKRESFNSIEDGTFSYTVVTGRLGQDYTDYGNSTGFLNYYISLLDTLHDLPINDTAIKNYIVVSYDVLFPITTATKIIKSADTETDTP